LKMDDEFSTQACTVANSCSSLHYLNVLLKCTIEMCISVLLYIKRHICLSLVFPLFRNT